MWCTGLVALWHMVSSRTRARTRVSCIGRQILNHCATREVPGLFISIELCPLFCTLFLITPVVMMVQISSCTTDAEVKGFSQVFKALIKNLCPEVTTDCHPFHLLKGAQRQKQKAGCCALRLLKHSRRVKLSIKSIERNQYNLSACLL